MALRPTVRDVEEASLRLGDGPDVFDFDRPLKGVAGDIVAFVIVGKDDKARVR
ncbi:MAG: hypothetical protein J2P54_21630 [Bradyrhizobiaceae bacterium]|nr:hypothetical protein [Bradyrhizobiaceae bacterium]